MFGTSGQRTSFLFNVTVKAGVSGTLNSYCHSGIMYVLVNQILTEQQRTWFRLKEGLRRHMGKSDLPVLVSAFVLCLCRQCISPLLQLLHGGSDLITAVML